LAEIGRIIRKKTEGRPSKETVVNNDNSLPKHNTQSANHMDLKSDVDKGVSAKDRHITFTGIKKRAHHVSVLVDGLPDLHGHIDELELLGLENSARTTPRREKLSMGPPLRDSPYGGVTTDYATCEAPERLS
jgi:hypothetical protein